MWLTQRHWHKGCVYYKGKTSSDSLWTSANMTKWLGSMIRQDRHTMRQWRMHSFERLKGLAWLMKVDRHGDQLNTQLTDMIVQTSAIFKGKLKKFFPLQSKQSLCQYFWVSPMVTTFTSFQNYVLSCVVDVGLIMSLLQQDYSGRHQLIIQEIVLKTKT